MTSQTIDYRAVDAGAGIALVPTTAWSPRLTDEQRDAYVSGLLAEAAEHCGWLWVRTPSASLIATVRATWAIIAPGWVLDRDGSPSPDATVAAIIAHYGISHHLGLVGVRLMERTRAAAYRVLATRPALASATVLGILGHGEAASLHSLSALLTVEGSSVAKRERRLDTEDFDEFDGVGGYRVTSSVVSGEPIERFILRLADAPVKG